MKIRRLAAVGLAAYAGWKRLSPAQRASIKNRVPGVGRKRDSVAEHAA